VNPRTPLRRVPAEVFNENERFVGVRVPTIDAMQVG